MGIIDDMRNINAKWEPWVAFTVTLEYGSPIEREFEKFAQDNYGFMLRPTSTNFPDDSTPSKTYEFLVPQGDGNVKKAQDFLDRFIPS